MTNRILFIALAILSNLFFESIALASELDSYRKLIFNEAVDFQRGTPDHHLFYDVMATEEGKQDADEQAEARVERQKTILALEKIISTNPRGPKDLQLYFRIAELYEREADDLRLESIARFVTASSIATGTPTGEPQLDLKASDGLLLKQINVLRQAAGNFSRHPHRPKLLYRLAMAMARMGQENATYYFREFFKTKKEPDLARRAHAGLGDLYFQRQRWDEAIAEYGYLRKSRDPELKAYATYRLAWAFYRKNAGSPKETLLKKCISAFKLAAIYAKTSDLFGDRRFDLGSAAVQDFAWLMAMHEKRSEAHEFFAKREWFAAQQLFNEKLAAHYYSKKNYVGAAAVYRRLIETHPESSRLPHFYQKLLAVFADDHRYTDVLRAAAALEKLLRSERWRDVSHENNVLFVGTQGRYQKFLERTADRYFDLAQNDKWRKHRTPLLLTAIDLYQRSLPIISDQVASVRKAQFNVASAYLILEDYRRALAVFDQVASAEGGDGSLRKRAAYNVVMIINVLDQQKEKIVLPEAGKAKNPIAMPKIKKHLEAAIDSYLEIEPKAEEAANLRYEVAKNYYLYGHYEEAMGRFEKLAERHPKGIVGRAAIETIFGHVVDRKNWLELLRLSKKFLAHKSIRDKDLRKYFRESKEYAEYALAK